MEKIIKEKFNGQYPVRKSIQTSFAHRGEVGILFQVDAIALKERTLNNKRAELVIQF